jgi:hypothetical protein
VTKGKHDLQRQRYQRQHRAVPFMPKNKTHSPDATPLRPHATPNVNVTMLHHARAGPLSILGQHVSALVNSRTLLRIMSM